MAYINFPPPRPPLQALCAWRSSEEAMPVICSIKITRSFYVSNSQPPIPRSLLGCMYRYFVPYAGYHVLFCVLSSNPPQVVPVSVDVACMYPGIY